MLLLTNDFNALCENAIIYLDTNAFIYAADNAELNDLYIRLADRHKTAFVTLNSVEYEFTRGARTLQELTDRRDYVRSLASILSVNKLLDSEKNLSADARAFPLDIFSISGAITFSTKSFGVMHMNLYDLDEKKYVSLLKTIG